MRVRLTKKLARELDGVDVSSAHIGDVVDLPDRAAMLLIAEGWAEPHKLLSRGSAPDSKQRVDGKPARKS